LEIRQSFTVPFAADQVWRCFHDIEAIVGCLPGAGLAEPPREGQLALSMMVRLGPIVANFAGQGEMTFDESARCGRITGSGSDRKSGSRVKGEAGFSLHEERVPTASTRIDIRVDYSIAGSLAQFSRGRRQPRRRALPQRRRLRQRQPLPWISARCFGPCSSPA
jgi:carbon monoxide dehydrogenase subunit G